METIQSGQLTYHGSDWAAVEQRQESVAPDERGARISLRTQIARLERELSVILVQAFPHLSIDIYGPKRGRGPRLLDLAELEVLRDHLAQRVTEARAALTRRRRFEHQSQELLRAMKLEPARYKFARLPVRDLGQGTCGVWKVRPRLGLIGMFAGWWEVKLASGCPLP